MNHPPYHIYDNSIFTIHYMYIINHENVSWHLSPAHHLMNEYVP